MSLLSPQPLPVPPLSVAPTASERAAALTRFTMMRLEAFRTLSEAAQLHGLSDLHRAQALAAAGIIGTRFHRVYGEASAEDAVELRTGLDAIARAVDPLIAQIGNEATSNFHGIDGRLFVNQVRDALDGDAVAELNNAAERLGEEDDAPDSNAEHRTHGGRG